MSNITQLVTEISKPRYDTAVVSGKNRILLALLDEDEQPAKTVFRSVPAEDVREAIGDGVRGMTADQIQLLRLYVGGDGNVDFAKTNIRTEIRTIFTGNQPVLDRLQAVATRPKKYCDNCGGQPALKQLFEALRLISKSYLATYMANAELEKQAQENKIATWLAANPDTSDPPLKPSRRRSDAIKAVLDG